MRALVTGCAGFIGSHLTESLLADGHVVLGVDCFNDNYGRRDKLENLAHAQHWEGFEFVPIDLSRGDLDDLVEECDVVFHLAAEPGVRASWSGRFETYLRNNVLATQQLLEAARRVPERRVVYASSSSVYGRTKRLPTGEDVLPQPHSPYGVTKLAAEHLCRLYHANYGVDAVSLRYFTAYGPRQRPDMAFALFCRAALAGEPVTVYGDGGQTRDFTFVGDIVAATRAAADAPAVGGRAYNVGAGSRASIREALAILSDCADRPVEVHHADDQRGEVRDTAADTTAARSDLGFAPAVSLRAGLEAQFAWEASRLAGAPPARR